MERRSDGSTKKISRDRLGKNRGRAGFGRDNVNYPMKVTQDAVIPSCLLEQDNSLAIAV